MKKCFSIFSIFLYSMVSFASEPDYLAIKPHNFYDGSFLTPLTTEETKKLRLQISSLSDKSKIKSAYMHLIAHGDTTAMVDWANILIGECKDGVKTNKIYQKLSEAMAWDMLALEKNWLERVSINKCAPLENLSLCMKLITTNEIILACKNNNNLLDLCHKIGAFAAHGFIADWRHTKENHIKFCLELLDGTFDPFVHSADRQKKFFWFCKSLTGDKSRQQLTEGVWERFVESTNRNEFAEILFHLNEIIPSHFSSLVVGRLFQSGDLGRDLDRNKRLLEALKYYQKSHATAACEHVADLYVEGISIDNLTQHQLDLDAEYFYLKANTPEAKCSLASLYLKGRAGVKLTNTIERQERIMELLTQSGTPEALYLQGTLIEAKAEKFNDPALFKEAQILYQKSASADGLCALGRMCWQGRSGLGLSPDQKESLSINYLKKADTEEAHSILGTIYEAKAKKRQDESYHYYALAAQSYEKSATPMALCALGKLYEDGHYCNNHGRTKRFQEAFKLYEKSATPEAKFLIGMLHKTGRKDPHMTAEKRHALAYQYFKQAKTPLAYHTMAEMVYQKLVETHLNDSARFEATQALCQKAQLDESCFMMGWILLHHEEPSIENHLAATRWFESMKSDDKNFGIAMLYLKSPLYVAMDSLEKYKKVIKLLNTKFSPEISCQASTLMRDLKKLIFEEEKNRESPNSSEGGEDSDENEPVSSDSPVTPEEDYPVSTKSTAKPSFKKVTKEQKKHNQTVRHQKQIQEMTASLGIIPGAHSATTELPIVFLNATVEKNYNDFDTNPLTSAKLNNLINDIQRYGHELLGEGQPEILRNNQNGLRSRRINGEDRITYKVEHDRIVIHSCGGHY